MSEYEYRTKTERCGPGLRNAPTPPEHWDGDDPWTLVSAHPVLEPGGWLDDNRLWLVSVWQRERKG